MLDFPRRAIALAVIHIGIEHIDRNVAFHVGDFRFHLVAQAPFLKLRLSDFVVEFRQVVGV
ncbi:hypothetical protein D3C85_1441410 [compost metagenome]